jgi:hypothetical protein
LRGVALKNPDILHEGKYQFFSGNLGSPNLIKSDFTLGGHLGEELTGMSDWCGCGNEIV